MIRCTSYVCTLCSGQGGDGTKETSLFSTHLTFVKPELGPGPDQVLATRRAQKLIAAPSPLWDINLLMTRTGSAAVHGDVAAAFLLCLSDQLTVGQVILNTSGNPMGKGQVQRLGHGRQAASIRCCAQGIGMHKRT